MMKEKEEYTQDVTHVNQKMRDMCESLEIEAMDMKRKLEVAEKELGV